MTIRVEDHLAIRNLLAEYCLLLDMDDIDEWVSLFTPDAQYEVYGHSFDGHEGLRRMMKGAPRGLHLGGPPMICSIRDDHAETKQNLLFVDGATRELRSAVYTDDLVRTTDGWRIAKRRCQFIVADGLSDRPDE